MQNLFIFIDESGNFDFSVRGTNHLVICSYSTTEPEENANNFQKFKYELLSDGVDQECFHATEDLQIVRDNIFSLIREKSTGDFDFVSIVKNKQPVNIEKKEIYTSLVKALLKCILERNKNKSFNSIIVVIDQTLTRKEQGYLKQIIKSELKTFRVPFHIYFFSTKSDHNSQIADYGSWSKYVSLERSEYRPIKEINKIIKSDLDLSEDK